MKQADLIDKLNEILVVSWHGCGAADCHAPPAVKPDPAQKCKCVETLASALARLAGQVQKEGIGK